MLNGLYPVLVISLPANVSYSALPGVIRDLLKNTAPIPIYLDEDLTGVAVISEDQNIQINSNTVASVNNDNSLEVLQRGLNNQIDINLQSNRNSIFMNIVLPILKVIFAQRLMNGNYNIAYFSQNNIIFNAKLANFVTEQNADDELVNIKISLLQTEEKKEKPKPAPGNSGTALNPKLEAGGVA